MRKEAAKRLTRLLVFDIFRRNFAAFALCLLFLACIILWATNFAISRQMIEGRFVRWTMQQSQAGPGTPYAFVDLLDGRTVGALTSQNWRPPEPGSVVKVEEGMAFWGGRSYRIVP